MKRQLRPADLLLLRSVTDVTMSPDDKTVAYSVSHPDGATNTYQSQIHLYRDAQSCQITFGHSDTSPVFSRDGSRLAFLRSEPGLPAQPWVYSLESGEVQPVATFEDGATKIAWGHRDLYVLATARPADEVGVEADELASKIRVITTLDYRFDGRGWTNDRKGQVYRCSLRGGTPKLLTDPTFDHTAFAIRSDGSSLLVVNNSNEDSDLNGTNSVWSINVVQGDRICLTPSGAVWAQVGWTDIAQPFAVGSLDAWGGLLKQPFILSSTEAPVPLTDSDVNHVNGIGTASEPIAVSGALLISANRRGMTNLDLVPTDGGPAKTIVDGPFMIADFAANSTGSTVFAAVTTPSRPAELWKFENGLSTLIASLNDDLLNEIELARTETVRIPSTDGVEVEAWVVTPPTCVSDPANVKPGLVYIHGGPFFSYGYNFFDEFQLAAAEGYVVIGSNPRGSDGYGAEWGTSILGATGASDWQDIQAVTDYLASRADVDANRLGIGGGSYGGYLSSWAVAHSDRYSAALLERGLYSGESFMGTSDIASFFGPVFFGSTIEADIDGIRQRSPLTHAANITTPSLIVHAENDFRCPIEQAEQLFAALRRNGTEATFVRIPDESHGLTRSGKPNHRVERFEIVHEFFAKHLKPRST